VAVHTGLVAVAGSMAVAVAVVGHRRRVGRRVVGSRTGRGRGRGRSRRVVGSSRWRRGRGSRCGWGVGRRGVERPGGERMLVWMCSGKRRWHIRICWTSWKGVWLVFGVDGSEASCASA